MLKEAALLTAKEYIRQNLNVPNALTLLRLFLIPVYIVLFANGLKNAALLVFLAACFTDLLDGYIARKYHLVTNFGKLMDPFADKAMVITAMLSMTIGNSHIEPVIPWTAVIILLLKELFMMAGGLLLLRNGIVVYSYMIGKVAQCVFVGALASTFFHAELLSLLPALWMPLDEMLIWLAVGLTLCALVFYVQDSVKKARAAGLLGKAK